MTLTMPETAAPTFIEPASGTSAAACASWCEYQAPEFCQGLCRSEDCETPLSLHDGEPVKVHAAMSIDGQPSSEFTSAGGQPAVSVFIPEAAAEEMGGIEMTPAEARRFARLVLDCADTAERG